MGILSFFSKQQTQTQNQAPIHKKTTVEKRVKILVLDDDTDLLDTLKQGRYPEDVQMIFTSDPRSVLSELNRDSFDAIFADVHMPREQEVNEKLKELASDIPIYRMSAIAPTMFLNMQLRKPFTLNSFEEKIKDIRELALYLQKSA